MSTDSTPGPDPFLLQTPLEIAAEIAEMATHVHNDFADLREELIEFAEGEGSPADGPDDEQRERVIDCRDHLASSINRLGRPFALLSGWWVADHPPAFAPKCVSAVDAIIETAAHLVACLETPMTTTPRPTWESGGHPCEPARMLPREPAPIPVGFGVQCWYASRRVEYYDDDVIRAALRCEASAMSRRPPPPTTSVMGYPELHHQFRGSNPGFVTAAVVMEMARIRIRRDLPEGWDSMPNPERLARLDATPRGRRATARRAGRPSNDPALVARVVELEAADHSWSAISKLINSEFRASTTAEQVRSTFRRATEQRDTTRGS